MSGTAGDRGAQRRARRPERSRSRRHDDEPVLPDTSRDERDVGWGEEPGERNDEWYRRERPPHHE